MATTLQETVGAALPCSFDHSTSVSQSGKLPSGVEVELSGDLVRVHTSDPEAVQPVLDALRGAGVVIREVRAQRQSLEDFFIDVVGPSQEGTA